MGENDEIMVVALANGVRVEQRFTGDAREALESLVRMEHDASLWPRTFEPLTEQGFFNNLAVAAGSFQVFDYYGYNLRHRLPVPGTSQQGMSIDDLRR
jgi:hypothetical protein